MFNFIAQLPLGRIEGIGPLGLEDKDPSGAASLFVNTLSMIIGVLTASAIIWFVFQFLIGGIQWISAGGDAKAIEAARGRITNAIVGIVIVFTALLFISVIGALLGIDILGAIGSLLGVEREPGQPIQ